MYILPSSTSKRVKIDNNPSFLIGGLKLSNYFRRVIYFNFLDYDTFWILSTTSKRIKLDCLEAIQDLQRTVLSGELSAQHTYACLLLSSRLQATQVAGKMWMKTAASNTNNETNIIKSAALITKFGDYYYYGTKGLPENKNEAVRRYTLAAKQGCAKAQYNLGVMYEHSEVV